MQYPEKHFFLPFQGEFGWLIMHHIRAIHIYPSLHKTVCCARGEECLYPSATDFFYDFPELIPDDKRKTLSRTPSLEAMFSDLSANIRRQYPQYKTHTFVLPFLEGYHDTRVVHASFSPVVAQLDIPRTDVVITPRMRLRKRNRNLPFWSIICRRLKAEGHTVAIVGKRATSYDVPEADQRSWDYGGIDACIQMMRQSRLVISQNCGLAHLAVFLKRPTVLMRTGSSMLGRMEQQRHPGVYFNVVPVSADCAITASLRFLVFHAPQHSRVASRIKSRNRTAPWRCCDPQVSPELCPSDVRPT